jgi:hypothetical protein
VEGPIMQAKECTGAFGRCNKWSTWAQRSQRGDDRAGRKPSQGGARSHPGRSAQAVPPPLQIASPGARLLQSSSSLLPLFVCSSFCAQNHHRHSHPSQA